MRGAKGAVQAVRMRIPGWTLMAAAVVLHGGMLPALASHDVDGFPEWRIPWVATVFLMGVPYLLIGGIIWRLYRARRQAGQDGRSPGL